ncbi:MAG: preprotein translocase subunit SecY [Oscillospiraceae bacterium]|nr:preprotein translocase subunit SecY [Oscillospiraceae bacterium]
MIDTIRKAWGIPELRRKIFYTIMLIVVFRIGAVIPVPFMSPEMMQTLIGDGGGSLLNMLDTFSGGAFANATIFAMSITPYINASIIMQLLTVAIPALERLQKEGETGRKKINQITRYLAVVLGFVQASGLYLALSQSGALGTSGALPFLTITFTFTAGTAFLMWLGEQINEKGIGNGISLLIFAGIVARGPVLVQTIWDFIVRSSYIPLALALIASVAIIASVVFMNTSERRIQVQYAKRVVGRKMFGGQATHIPIKLLSAGVLPIIFAMSILAFPTTLGQFFGVTGASGGFMGGLMKFLSMDNWPYALAYFLLIIFFTYFYTAIQFNPVELSNNIKNNGGFIPGIRPGKPTTEHISKILSRITLAGAVFLGFIAVLPIVVSMTLSEFSGLAFGGTSLLIVVGVAIETSKQLESQMLVRNYKGFLE